jgi:hypothetical protein
LQKRCERRFARIGSGTELSTKQAVLGRYQPGRRWDGPSGHVPGRKMRKGRRFNKSACLHYQPLRCRPSHLRRRIRRTSGRSISSTPLLSLPAPSYAAAVAQGVVGSSLAKLTRRRKLAKRAPATTRNNNHLTGGSLSLWVCEAGSRPRCPAEGIARRCPVPAPLARGYQLPELTQSVC